MRQGQSERGATLLIVLWVVSLLALLVVAAGARGWTENKATQRELEQIRDQRCVLAAVEYAKRVLSRNPAAWDSLGALETLKVSADEPVSLYDADVALSLEDEDGKINLNNASLEILRRLPGMTEEAVAAILDWRDADSAGNAEEAYYRSLSVPYRCKNGPFESVEELRLVRGITPELYSSIAPWLTVYGTGKVNFNTAPAEVLIALGLPEKLSDAVVKMRVGPDERIGTEDDRFAATVAQIEPFLTSAAESSEEKDQVRAFLEKIGLGVRSAAFRIHLDVLRGRRGVQARREIVVASDLGRRIWEVKQCLEIY